MRSKPCRLVASGSDDVQVIIWDPFLHKAVTTVRTGHQGNIFSVKVKNTVDTKSIVDLICVHAGEESRISFFSLLQFLPNSNDSIVVTGAADCKIRVHDINAAADASITHVFSCHAGRVKRLATAPNIPFMFWSAAEDGTIMYVIFLGCMVCTRNASFGACMYRG